MTTTRPLSGKERLIALYTKWGLRWLAVSLLVMVVTGGQCDLVKKMVVAWVLALVMIPPLSFLFPILPFAIGIAHIASLLAWAGSLEHLYGRCVPMEWNVTTSGLMTPPALDALKVSSKTCFSRWCV